MKLLVKARNAAAKLDGDPQNGTGYCPAKKPTPNRAFQPTSVNKWRKMNGVAAVVANLECFCLELRRISRQSLNVTFCQNAGAVVRHRKRNPEGSQPGLTDTTGCDAARGSRVHASAY